MHPCHSVFSERVVRIAVQPSFPVFAGRDHRMSGGTRVLAGVLVRRAVAATRPAALLTGAQMNPLRTYLDAVLTLLPFGVLDVVDALDVLACSSR